MCHTQAKVEGQGNNDQGDRKRILCEKEATQPSIQPRKRRRKEPTKNKAELGTKIKIWLGVTKGPEEVNTKSAGYHQIKTKNISEPKIPKTAINIKNGGSQQNRKSRNQLKKMPAQKNKITNFFEIIPTKKTGLADLGWVEKLAGGEDSDRISDLHFHNEYESNTAEAKKDDQMDFAVKFYCSTDEELQLEMHME